MRLARVAGGPFGVSQTPPFANCLRSVPTARRPTATPASFTTTTFPSAASRRSAPPTATPCPIISPIPGDPRALAPPSNPSAADLANYLPNAASIISGAQPFTLGDYNRTNKLPYSINLHARSAVAASQRPDASTSAMWAIWAVTRSSRCPSTRRRLPLRAASPTRAARLRRISPMAIRSIDPDHLLSHLRQQRRRTARTDRCSRTTREATSTSAFPTSAIRRNPSPTQRPGSRPTTPCRCTLKNGSATVPDRRLLYLLPRHRRTERPWPLLQRQQSQ